MLTGVDITDYGQDLPSKPTLGALLKRVFKMIKQDDFRLRLSSVDVVEYAMIYAIFLSRAKIYAIFPSFATIRR